MEKCKIVSVVMVIELVSDLFFTNNEVKAFAKSVHLSTSSAQVRKQFPLEITFGGGGGILCY
jgi:hypothetical protein